MSQYRSAFDSTGARSESADDSTAEGLLRRLRRWASETETSESADERLRRALLHGAIAVGAVASDNPEPIFLSAVLPVFNEQENLPALFLRLVPVLESIGTYEIIFVNDGSNDSSAALILNERLRNDRVKLVNFSRNFGHQAALSAGLRYSQGAAVVLLDADLQDPPESLPLFLAKWREGYQVVYAVRQKRKEGVLKRSAYFLFYRLLQQVASIPIPLDSGDFCLLDRRVVDEIVSLPEHNRFLRGLRSWVGFRQIGVTYEREARFAGEPKYTMTKLMKLAVDGLVSFTTSPLRLAMHIGLLVAGTGMIYLLYILIGRFVGIESPPGWTSLTAIVLILGGLQLVLIGLQGEYIGRIYDESKKRPEYIVHESYGISSSSSNK